MFTKLTTWLTEIRNAVKPDPWKNIGDGMAQLGYNDEQIAQGIRELRRDKEREKEKESKHD